MKDLEFKIAKLSLSQNDILVVKVDMIISTEMALRIKDQIGEATGHERIVVIDKHIDLSVLSPSDIEARAA